MLRFINLPLIPYNYSDSRMAKSKFQQAMLIGIGIMVAIGFSGVFTYSNIVQTGESRDRDRQEFNASIPTQNYIDGNFELSIREQANLAVNNQVTFVNLLYTDNKTDYSKMNTIPSTFNNSVYINSINMSESTFAANRDVSTPSALVIGDQPTRTRRGTIPYSISKSEISKTQIVSAVCSSINTDRIGQFGATCIN